MAFNPLQFLRTDAAALPKTFNDVRTAAQGILDNAAFFKAIGNTSMVNAAKAALQWANGGDPRTLDTAYKYVTGSYQLGGTTARDYSLKKFDVSQLEVQQELSEAKQNLANATAKYGNDPSKWAANGASTSAIKQFQDLQHQVDVYAPRAKELGVESSLAQDSHGNWIPASQVAQANAYDANGKPLIQAAAAGTTSPASSSITFKDGLNDQQKQELTLLSSKPADQWTDTDKKNWAYGTNGSAIPGTQAASGTAGGQTFYRVGSDIYDASTGRKLGPTEWNASWSGKATEVAAPGSGRASAGTGSSGLSPDQQAAADHLINSASTDAQLLATMDLTPAGIQAAIQRYLPTAQAESDPYYKQLYTRAAENYNYGMKKLATDRQLQLETEAANAQQNMETANANSAEAGLATSGIRKKLQDRLNAHAENIAQSDFGSFNEAARSFGRSNEEYLGSSHLPTGVPMINGVPIFTASGNVKGSLEAEQTTANQTEASRLARANNISSLSTLTDSAQAGIEKYA